MAFFTLGFMDSNKSIVIANFILDIVLCAVSLVLNVILLSAKYKILENGLPPKI